MPDISEKLSFTLEQELGVSGMEVPNEVQVLPAGKVSPRGKTAFLVDEEARRDIIAAFAASRTDLVIDYEHQSLSGSEAPAAGWIKDITDRGDLGLWAKVQWTDRAKEYLRNREYRYLSPVVLIRKKDGRAVELLGAALTNLPAIDGMEPVVNRVDPVHAQERICESVPDGEACHSRESGNPATFADKPYKDMFAGVLKMFELPEAAGLDDVRAKVTTLLNPEGFVPKDEFQALKDTLETAQAEAMIKEALSLGKITPSLVSWARAYVASDPEGFREFIGRACPVVPLKQQAGASGPPLLHKAQREVNRLLGISDEAYIRHSPESAPGQ